MKKFNLILFCLCVSAYAQLPDTPTALVATGGNNIVNLSWTTSNNATGYRVKRSTSPTSPVTAIANVPGSTFSDTSVVNGTTYYYAVSATNASGQSGNSNRVTVTPTAGTPPPPPPPTIQLSIMPSAIVCKNTWTGSQLSCSQSDGTAPSCPVNWASGTYPDGFMVNLSVTGVPPSGPLTLSACGVPPVPLKLFDGTDPNGQIVVGPSYLLTFNQSAGFGGIFYMTRGDSR